MKKLIISILSVLIFISCCEMESRGFNDKTSRIASGKDGEPDTVYLPCGHKLVQVLHSSFITEVMDPDYTPQIVEYVNKSTGKLEKIYIERR